MNLDLDQMERMRRPGRKIQGISAVLLPYEKNGRMDEAGFLRHLRRTLDAGLRPAVNMDTGYGDLLTPGEKRQVLDWTEQVTAGPDGFTAGAWPQEKRLLVTRVSAKPFGKGVACPLSSPRNIPRNWTTKGCAGSFTRLPRPPSASWLLNWAPCSTQTVGCFRCLCCKTCWKPRSV